MKYQEFKPSPPLQHYVHYFAILEHLEILEAPVQEIVPPSLCKALIFYYQFEQTIRATNPFFDNRLPVGFVLAHGTVSNTWTFEGGFSMFTVMFKPGKFRCFFPFSVLEFLNKPLPFAEIGERALLDLHEQIVAAKNVCQRIDLTETYLLKKLSSPYYDGVDHALFLMNQDNSLTVDTISHSVFMSPRNFRRVFEREMGIAPKKYLEILRISRAVECLRFTQPPPKIGDLALICGFYDESHFIESFKSFTGLTPKQFLKNNTPVTDSVTWRDEVLHERTLVY